MTHLLYSSQKDPGSCFLMALYLFLALPAGAFYSPNFSAIKSLPGETEVIVDGSVTSTGVFQKESGGKVTFLKVVGTGRTTGHIITLTVRNDSDEPVAVDASYIYIPPTGKYQPYVGRIPKGTVIPPGSTVDIPVAGYCADIHSPPVPDGGKLPSISDWVTVADDPVNGTNIFPNPPVASYHPVTFPTLSGIGDYTPYDEWPSDGYIPTLPGTTVPVAGTLPKDGPPDILGPVLISVVQALENTAPEVLARDSVVTPFSGNPPRELETVIQQSFWIYTSLLYGTPYDSTDFQEKVYTQYTEASGISVTAMPPEEKEKLDSGVDQFWSVFQAVGVEAKVIKDNTGPPPEEDSVPPPEKMDTSNCAFDSDFTFNPELDYDHKIAESWGNEDDRKKIIDDSRASIASGASADLESAYSEYDIAYNPTSTVAFWRSNHVGGFASAYAKTWFKRVDGASEWVWNTESLSSSAQGSHNFWMEVTPDEDCRSIVIGTSVSRISARGKVFDAVAGNNENSLPTLRFYTWMGKKAVQFLIERKTGKVKGSFKDFIKDEATDEIKDAFKEKLEEKAQEVMDQLLDKMGVDPEALDRIQEFVDKFSPPDIEEALEELLGIDIPSIEEGIDAAFNLFFWSNTYATAFGAMNISVGDSDGTVKAETRNMYLRQGLEDSEDAVIGKKDQCDQLILSDAKPGRLEIDAWGLSTMTAKADGNGYATAELHSMHFELLIGICICPGEVPQIVSAEVGGWFQPKDHGSYGLIDQSVMDKFRDDAVDHIRSKIASGELGAGSEVSKWSEAIQGYSEKWAGGNGYVCSHRP